MWLASKFLYLRFIYTEVRGLSVLTVFFNLSYYHYDRDVQIPDVSYSWRLHFELWLIELVWNLIR
jgi:hypothetical protein